MQESDRRDKLNSEKIKRLEQNLNNEKKIVRFWFLNNCKK